MSKRVVTAISGGICSGKSTVSSIIRECGYHVIDCDVIARQATELPEVLERLSEQFGERFVLKGTLNRRELANYVFENSRRTEQLNEITHPKILELLQARLASLSGYVFVEIALIDRAMFLQLFDNIWIVNAAIQVRIDRLTKRNSLTLTQAQNIINRQPDYLNIDGSAIIDNNGNLENLRLQVEELLKKI